MSLSKSLAKVRYLIFVSALAGLVWLVFHGQPVHSLPFLTGIPGHPEGQASCDDSQLVCPEGGTKSFGPFTMTFPNGFAMDTVRIYCGIIDASDASVPSHAPQRSPVAQPVYCYFGDLHTEEPVEIFLLPVQVTTAIPESEASHVALYTYQPSGWNRLTPDVPVSAGSITFSLERLNPVGSDNQNYFWLFESHLASPTPTTVPTHTPTATAIPSPTASPTLRRTATPTNSPTPAPTTLPTPTNAPSPTVVDTSAQGSSDGGSPLCIGGAMPGIGIAGGVILALRRRPRKRHD